MADTGLVLRTEGLCYETRNGTHVLRGVDLELARGQVRFILGSSGSGKSTLLRLLNRLLEPSAGRVTLQDRDVKDWNVRELRRAAVYVPQASNALGATLRADLSTPLQYAGALAEDSSLREALDVAQLESMALDRSTEALSAGELSRLALARALLLKPAVLLLDEPTAALDPNTAHALLRALGQWASHHGTALLIVTHRTSELGVLGGRVSLLQDGRIAGEQATLDLVEGRALCPAAAAFLEAERGPA